MRHWAETIAKRHLLLSGYVLLAENYSVRGGELDLIMQDRDTIVFVEVRQRARETHGTAAETITPRKIQKLQKTALSFLVEKFGRDDLFVRFDAVLITGIEEEYRLEHLENIL
ncbi:MAG: YraN family protein [Trueperaceae bacterium]